MPEQFTPTPTQTPAVDGSYLSRALALYLNQFDSVESGKLLGRWSELSQGPLNWVTLGDGLRLSQGVLSATPPLPALVYNVRTYGAVGDGLTNDQPAIQAAIDAATLAGGGIVWFPAGVYRVTQTLVLASGITLQGVGSNATTGMTSTIDGRSLGAFHTVYGYAVTDTHLQDLYIIGPWNASGSGIKFDGACGRNHLTRIMVNRNTVGATGHCIELAVVGSVITSVFTNVLTIGGEYGITVGASCTSLSFLSCYTQSATIAGWSIAGTYHSLNGCAADFNLDGYLIQGATGVSLQGCGAESSGRSAFHVDGGSGIVVAACRGHLGNTTADAGYPSFLNVTGGATAITVLNPSDTSPDAATVYSIMSSSSTSGVSIAVHGTDGLALPIEATVPAVVVTAGAVQPPVLAFADLPASPVTGMTANVSDSNTATWGATVAAGGGNQVLVRYNGANWTVVGV